MSNGGNKSNNLILGLSNTLNHDGDARTLVGVSHTTAGASSNGGIFAGFQNTLSHDRSVVIGGGGIATEAANTVYVPNFVTTGSATIRANAIVTGSLTVNGSITGNGGFTGSLLGTASFANTATTASFYSLAAVTQNAVFSGSVRGEVRPLSISSNTASLDCSLDNFFTLQLVAGTDTRIEPSNINPGQTINLRVNTTGSATIS